MGGRRLVFSTAIGHGHLDAAWWPRSDDLPTELPVLVEHLPEGLGRVVRVVYSRQGWGPVPRRIDIGNGRSLRVAPFAGADTHRMLLQMSRGQVLQIMVVPFDLGADAAAHVMTAAASADNHLSALALLAETTQAE